MDNITLRHITSATDPMTGYINSLYHASFPEAERRPWAALMQLIGPDPMPFFNLYAAVTSDNKFAGFVSTWRLPDSLYIEHLAVEPTMRSNGVGGAILDTVRNMASDKPVVVEVELPESNDDAPRRIAFYERHGFKAMADFDYFQPPYAPGLPDVQLMLMTTRQLPDPVRFVIMLHTIVYNQ
ncbi:MAG: GNAT family N-acetyltransferase [Muribaculaceae bacterium]|nr:GNAT family N-acetyltransferase [Muribaculaceae bacterium]